MSLSSKKFSYNGNPKLKRIGASIEYTPEQVQEYVKCANDPIYFIKKYIKIVNVDRGLINFELWDFQEEMVTKFVDDRFVICKLPRQVGKDLTLDELIPTPLGFVKMRDLRVGDQVFDEFGKKTQITFVSDDVVGRGYKVTFDDGSSVICGKDHQWTVYDRHNQKVYQKDRKRIGYEHRRVTATIEDLYNSHWFRVNKRGYTEYSYYIPNTTAVEYCNKDLPIEPYLLGLWLGDGYSRTGALCGMKEHINFYANQLKEETFSNHFFCNKNANFVQMMNIEGLRKKLKEYNLLQTETGNKTKRIPPEYLFSSIDQRIALLQGLMDTDGFVEKNGICCIQLTRKNQPLIEDVYTLLCSLGLKVFRSIFEKTDSERLQFTVSRDRFDVCRVPHKLERQKKTLPNARYVYSRTIQNIEPVEQVVGRCIQVDSPNSLYLCTPSYIPTHNTTTAAATILWLVLFTENYSVAILANKMQQAREILSRIQMAYEHLPKWLQQGVLEWNKSFLELENGSKIIASATSSSAVRGGSFNLLYLDEFAFVPNNIQEEFFASVYPTISSGKTTKVLITSTPNGLNMFYKIWTDSEEGRNDYSRIDIHWSMVPGRDAAWRDQQVRNTSEEQFKIEFECEFIGSSSTLISSSKLKTLTYTQPIHKSDFISYYEEVRPKHTYLCVVDTSRGVGLDYSAFVIVDVTELPYRVVCTYRNNLVSTLSYPMFIIEACKYFNNAYILVETNDAGQQVCDILLQDLEYDGLLTTTQKKKTTQASGGFGPRTSFGIRTTKQVKRIGCASLKAIVESDRIITNDYNILQELSRFSLKGTSYEAEEGNDDLVMCLVLFSWLTAQPYFRDLTNVDIRRDIYQETEKMIEDNLVPFGIIDTGHEEELEDKILTAREFQDWMKTDF